MPTNIWDVTVPADTQLANLLGSDLRNFRLDTQQRMALISGTLAGRWNPGTDAQPLNWQGLLYFATDTKQIFQWSGAAWVDVTSSFVTGNVTVAAVNLAAQQAVVPSTLLYTPAATGYFRFSGLVTLTQAATSSSTLPTPALSWTDGDSSVVQSTLTWTFLNTQGNTLTTNTLGIMTEINIVIYAKTGVAINYSIPGYLSSGATPMQFVAHLRLEGPL